MGEVILTVTAQRGVTRVQVRGTTPREEKASLRLYNTLKPYIESIDVHIGSRQRGHLHPLHEAKA